jgi:hypothetical protein
MSNLSGTVTVRHIPGVTFDIHLGMDINDITLAFYSGREYYAFLATLALKQEMPQGYAAPSMLVPLDDNLSVRYYMFHTGQIDTLTIDEME